MYSYIPQKEQGAALLTTIIILLLLTVIGVAGINTTSTDLKITSNYRESKQHFYYCDGHLNLVVTDISSWLNSTSALLTNPNSTTYSFAHDFDSDGHDETNTTVAAITMNSSDDLPDLPHKSSPSVGSGYGTDVEFRRYAIAANHTDSATQVKAGCFKVFPDTD